MIKMSGPELIIDIADTDFFLFGMFYKFLDK